MDHLKKEKLKKHRINTHIKNRKTRKERLRLEMEKKKREEDYKQRLANLGPYDESRDAEFDKCIEKNMPEGKFFDSYEPYRNCSDARVARYRKQKREEYLRKLREKEAYERAHPTFFRRFINFLNPFS